MYKKNPIKNVDYIHDYYHYLGINVNASIDEIKKAYKQKSKEYHPDKVATLGDAIKTVSNRLYPLIVEGYKILSDDNFRKLFDENLAYFKEKKPSLISLDGYAMIDLSLESLDLDYLLSDSEEYPGQSNFRDKYEKLSGYNESTFNVIKNAYQLNPENEQLKKAYFEQMTHKNVYLNLKEMESYMGAGVLNKKETKVVGVFGYLDSINSDLEKISNQFNKIVDLRLLSADSQPILIGMDQQELKGDIIDVKNVVSLKYKETFDKKKQQILDVAKEKQDFLAEYVKIREFHKMKHVDTNSVEVIVLSNDEILCSIKVTYQDEEFQPAELNSEFSNKKLEEIDISHLNHNVYWLKWNQEVSFNIFVMEFINDICNKEID